MTINDAKYTTLKSLGYDDTIDGMYKTYLQDQTSTIAGTIQDLERLFFNTLGYTGTNQGMWFSYLGDSGYTGSLVDRLFAFWSDNIGFTGMLLESGGSFLLEDGSLLLLEG